MEVSTRQDGEKSRDGGEETGIMTILPCELILYILLCVDSHQTVRISQSSVHPNQDKGDASEKSLCRSPLGRHDEEL